MQRHPAVTVNNVDNEQFSFDKRREQNRIQPLGPEARAQLHSSRHITSLQGVIYALVANSLDAEASQIQINVDFLKGCCTVRDNGCGIASHEFEAHGGLCKMHHTSKNVSTQSNSGSTSYHGSSGTFLAELSAMCLLSISSTEWHNQRSSTLTLHHGRVIDRRSSDHNDALNNHECHMLRTSVLVRDLFGNMAVRVKQRPAATDFGSSDERSWDELKRSLVALLLAWPRDCTVKVQDDNFDDRNIKLSGLRSSAPVALTKQSLGQLMGRPVSSDANKILSILFQSKLAPPDSRQSWIPLSASTQLLTLKGLISLEPAPNKKCQFISIGVSPCGVHSPHSPQMELHAVINKVVADSSFGTVEGTSLGSNNSHPDKLSPSRINEADRLGRQSLRSMGTRKGIDRYARYSLQIAFKSPQRSSASDAENINDASLSSMVDMLEAAMTIWLKTHHFRPRRRGKRSEKSARFTHHLPFPISKSSADHTEASVQEDVRASKDSRHQSGQDPVDSELADESSKMIHRSTPPPVCNDRSPNSAEWSLDANHFSYIRAGKSSLGAGVKRTGVDTQRYTPKSWSHRCEAGPRSLPNEKISLNQPLSERVDPKFKLRDERGNFKLSTSKYGNSPPPHMCQSGRVRGAGLLSPAANAKQTTSAEAYSDYFDGVDDAAILSAVLGAEHNVSAQQEHQHSGSDDLLRWTDPHSNQVFTINARTGVVLPHAANQDRPASTNTNLTPADRPISLSRRIALSTNGGAQAISRTEPPWLPSFLESWENPVFVAQSDSRISEVSVATSRLWEDDAERSCQNTDPNSRFPFALGAARAGTKLSKALFKHSEVVGQVDKKFILCKMASSLSHAARAESAEKDMIVLVDQHAASERIILEGLLDELTAEAGSLDDPSRPAQLDSAIKSTSLRDSTSTGKPLRYEVSAREHELLARYQDHFIRWGITYDLTASSSNADASEHRPPQRVHCITVTHLPTPIAERCARFPPLCFDMLRAEIWALADGEKRPTTRIPGMHASLDDPEHAPGLTLASPPWVRFLSAIPRGILDMLNSRACRSAIMFNDELSLSQCQELVEQLSECIFPFVCAHGRVSMVPLVSLGPDGEGGLEPSCGISRGLSRQGDNTGREEECGDLRKWVTSRPRKERRNGDHK